MMIQEKSHGSTLGCDDIFSTASDGLMAKVSRAVSYNAMPQEKGDTWYASTSILFLSAKLDYGISGIYLALEVHRSHPRQIGRAHV